MRLLEAEALMKSLDLEPIKTDSPAPHPFDGDVIFICVDIESWERCHSKITEIGISTLDTR